MTFIPRDQPNIPPPATNCSRDYDVGPRDAGLKPAGSPPPKMLAHVRALVINDVSRDLFLYFTLHVTYYVDYDAHLVIFRLSRDYIRSLI